MRKVLVVVPMVFALAGPAWGQTSWSNDQFSVTSDTLLEASIVNGSLEIGFPDVPYSFSNPGTTNTNPPSRYDLDFAPKPGYALAGEQVTFTVETTVDSFDAPADFLEKAYAHFAVDINGEYSFERSSDGGVFHDGGNYDLSSPMLRANASAMTFEGVACPLGEGANDCNFGFGNVFLDSSVEFMSFSVTPILTPVPEPDTAALLATALGSLALVAAARRRKALRTALR